MTVRQTLIDAINKLQKAGLPSPHLDGEILLSDALGKPKEFLYAHPEYQISKSVRIRHALFLQRRLNREPVAYIINKKEFYGLDFYVDRRVLIPRPGTESLIQNSKLKIQNVIKNSKLNSKFKIVIIDVGTGSGCIIISLIKELLKFSTQIKFYATDISADALAVAKINAKKHGVKQYIKFYQGDLLEPILNSKFLIFNFKFLIVIANLPYITPKKYLTLEPEIKKYEPKLALLTPNQDADYYYKKLDKQIKKLKNKTGAKIWKFYERP